MNELIFIFILLIISGTIITTFHFFEKFGIKLLLVIMTILYFIMSFKTTNIFGMTVNMNVIPTITIYIILYLLLNKYNKKEFKEDIRLLFNTIIVTIPVFVVFILFTQSINDSNILNINHIKDFIPSIISFIIMPVFVVLTFNYYDYLKKFSDNINLNIVMCTITSSIIESIVVNTIIYVISYDIRFIIHVSLASYIFKIFIILIYIGVIRLNDTRKKWLS